MNNFCIPFLKKINILNALHVFSDEIFINILHHLLASILFNFVVNFAHTCVSGLAITKVLISTSLETSKVVGTSIF